jgi:DNA polymerase
MIEAKIPIFGAFEAWRDFARRFASAGVPADSIHWVREGEPSDLFGGAEHLPESLSNAELKVPKAFLELSETVVCHSSPQVFPILYRVLLRLQDNPSLLENPADRDVNALHGFSKEIRRDSHKMKAFVRFKEMPDSTGPRLRFEAWFEPSHFIVERTAPFFARRFADMDWIIATPKGTASFISSELAFHPPAEKGVQPEDATDELWRSYYCNIFNPARLKVKAMTAEMPKKYWRNLPEASLIPDLIATAEERARAMQEKTPTMPPQHLDKFKAPSLFDAPEKSAYGSLGEAATAAKTCRRCPLYENAT